MKLPSVLSFFSKCRLVVMVLIFCLRNRTSQLSFLQNADRFSERSRRELLPPAMNTVSQPAFWCPLGLHKYHGDILRSVSVCCTNDLHPSDVHDFVIVYVVQYNMLWAGQQIRCVGYLWHVEKRKMKMRRASGRLFGEVVWCK